MAGKGEFQGGLRMDYLHDVTVRVNGGPFGGAGQCRPRRHRRHEGHQHHRKDRRHGRGAGGGGGGGLPKP